MCEALLARGDRVVASVRKKAVLDEMAAKYGDLLQVIVLDLSQSATIKPTIEAAFSQAGRLDPDTSHAAAGRYGAAKTLVRAHHQQPINTNPTHPSQ